MSIDRKAFSAFTAAFVFAAGLASTPLRSTSALAAETLPYAGPAFKTAQQDGKPTLVHIVAPWCTVCAAQRPILARLLADPKFRDLLVFEIDYDSQKDLVRQFGAQKQSTLIAFKGLKEEGRSTGDTSSASIAKLLDSTQ